jgi:hypothetical protein
VPSGPGLHYAQVAPKQRPPITLSNQGVKFQPVSFSSCFGHKFKCDAGVDVWVIIIALQNFFYLHYFFIINSTIIIHYTCI